MGVVETLEAHSIFDGAVVGHGFVDYNRDYRLVVEMYRGGSSKLVSELDTTLTLLFRGCVESHYSSKVLKGFSVDDTFIDYERWKASGQPDGFVWGVNFSEAYPGLHYVKASSKAATWAERLGLEMHEVVIETNAYDLNLVFHDVTVTEENHTS